ncbi:MAG: radical SAM protein [Microcystaceae cyanobacterium]
MNTLNSFASVYGPVVSWRYGCSLGIDPIGQVSTCSFNCVYCQLGEIEDISRDRRVFVPTEIILKDLQNFAPWDVDIITLSGSGEPTLALNLGDILSQIKTLTKKPILVLTNATTLDNPLVRKELAQADRVSVKLDGISADLIKRINRPENTILLENIIRGIELFSQQFTGELSLQTMVLSPWSEAVKDEYIAIIKRLNPQEIQLNTPTRPKPLKRELTGRGNHTGDRLPDYPLQILKCVNRDILETLAQELTQKTGLPVRCAPGHKN